MDLEEKLEVFAMLRYQILFCVYNITGKSLLEAIMATKYSSKTTNMGTVPKPRMVRKFKA